MRARAQPVAVDRDYLMRLIYEELTRSKINEQDNCQVIATNDGAGEDCILVKVGRSEYHVSVRKIW